MATKVAPQADFCLRDIREWIRLSFAADREAQQDEPRFAWVAAYAAMTDLYVRRPAYFG